MAFKWTPEVTEKELDWLIGQVSALCKLPRKSTEHARWTSRAVAFLDEVFGQDSQYSRRFAQYSWCITGTVLCDSDEYSPDEPVDQLIERKHQREFVRQLENARGLLMAAKDELRRVGLEGVYKGKNTGPESSDIVKVINLVEHKLRKAIREEPGNEKAVQDVMEALLLGGDVAYTRESEHIEYSTKNYIPDFSVRRLDLVIEVKLCNRTTREKELIAEINDDILAYGTKFGNQLYVVYDVGRIRDVDRFISAFEQHPNVIVRVVKH